MGNVRQRVWWACDEHGGVGRMRLTEKYNFTDEHSHPLKNCVDFKNLLWQPISIAPKDGTVVDLWCKSIDTSWRTSDCVWLHGEWYKCVHSDYESVEFYHGQKICEVTHWMPLPDPPADSADGAEGG